MKVMLKKIFLILIILFVIFILSIFCFRITKDIIDFDRNNTDELKVINANYFSSYKGTIFLKVPIGRNAFSFGIVFLGNKNRDIYTVRHEYGHYLQLEELGFNKYIKYIAIPSMYGYYSKVSYYDYYSQPWEYGAEIYGEVNRPNYKYSKDVLEKYNEYMSAIKR